MSDMAWSDHARYTNMGTFDEVAREVDFSMDRGREETQFEEPRREPIREETQFEEPRRDPIREVRKINREVRELRSQNSRTAARPSKDPVCIMCAPERHKYRMCKYNTPERRRQRLRALGRCQACLVSVNTHGVECSENAKCRDHEGERHVYWTCDGPHTWHPGPQSIILHNMNKARGRASGNVRGECSGERIDCEEDNNKNCILCPSKYHV